MATLAEKLHNPLVKREDVLSQYREHTQRIGTEQAAIYNEVMNNPREPATSLANRLGISRRSVQRWRKGKPPGIVRKIETVSQVLPVTLHKLKGELRPLGKLVSY